MGRAATSRGSIFLPDGQGRHDALKDTLHRAKAALQMTTVQVEDVTWYTGHHGLKQFGQVLHGYFCVSFYGDNVQQEVDEGAHFFDVCMLGPDGVDTGCIEIFW